jgi:hypothetical protein
MDLRTEVANKLDQANAVQIIETTGTVGSVFVFDKAKRGWVELTSPEKQGWTSYSLVERIVDIAPHEMRKKGSMLVVAKIDPMRAE